MTAALHVAGLLVGVALAALMGYAVQRGATCTVAAVDELVHRRSASRLVAMVEASLWVLGGLLIAQALHFRIGMPAGYAASGRTVLGGALLGLGAYVNRACVFGAIARLGSGEWAYVFTPLGFYAGCVSLAALPLALDPPPLPGGSPVLGASAWAALPFAGFMLWRVGRPWFDARPRERPWHAEIASRIWSPRAATTVIGIAFLLLLLLRGAWAYTDVLAELAHGMATMLSSRVVLLLGLFGGALLGGWTAGSWRATPLTLPGVSRCFAGGVLMGWGSLLIPGGNDGLILLGMPLLWPYAWLAFATMCVSIAAPMWVARARTAG